MIRSLNLSAQPPQRLPRPPTCSNSFPYHIYRTVSSIRHSQAHFRLTRKLVHILQCLQSIPAPRQSDAQHSVVSRLCTTDVGSTIWTLDISRTLLQIDSFWSTSNDLPVLCCRPYIDTLSTIIRTIIPCGWVRSCIIQYIYPFKLGIKFVTQVVGEMPLTTLRVIGVRLPRWQWIGFVSSR